MVKFKSFIFAAGALLSFTAASHGADMPLRGTAPVVSVAAPHDDFSGLYLRGDVGVGINRAMTVDTMAAANGFTSTGTSFNEVTSSHVIGAGIGYSWNSWLRTDITVDYRGGANISGRATSTHASNCCTSTQNYNSNISSIVGLANAYLDLGTWSGITPYVGGGIGLARNSMGPVLTNGISSCGGCVAPTLGAVNGGVKTNLAWALMAGLGYDVSRTTKLELGYRYMNLGGFNSGTSWSDACGCITSTTPLALGKMTAHDIRIGMRWQLAQPAAPMVGEPLVRKF